MSTRRRFIKNLSVQTAALPLMPLMSEEFGVFEPFHSDFQLMGEGDDFWLSVQQSYNRHPRLINLNNGGVSPQPKVVQEAFEHYNRTCNDIPAYQMWRVLEPGREKIREDLADLLGATKDEIVINRNTTEALDTIIFGMNLSKGDEVVLTHYDYPNMRNAWEQRKKRDGIILKYVDIELPRDNDETIVAAFESAMTSKTKLVHITHMVNYNGQVLPAKAISEAASKKNIPVLVDGAHTFVHIDFKLEDIPCDFFGTSLHKWLCAPFGNGMMYIKREQIEHIWPSYPTDAIENNSINKFEAMGTRSVPAEMAVAQAIQYHQQIGMTRKYERLKELTDYWTTSFEKNERFISYTPRVDQKYGALYTFGIDGMKSGEISNYLQKSQGIITSPISLQNIEGCRISPHIYTTKSDLDKLMSGIHELIKS